MAEVILSRQRNGNDNETRFFVLQEGDKFRLYLIAVLIYIIVKTRWEDEIY